MALFTPQPEGKFERPAKESLLPSVLRMERLNAISASIRGTEIIGRAIQERRQAAQVQQQAAAAMILAQNGGTGESKIAEQPHYPETVQSVQPDYTDKTAWQADVRRSLDQLYDQHGSN